MHQTESPAAHILPLSARHPDALTALARAYAECLSRVDAPLLRDVCYSAATGRAHHNHRLAVVSESSGGMVDELRAFALHGRTEFGHSGKVAGRSNGRVVFVFTGMGPQRPRMGIELFDAEPVFRRAAIEVDDLFTSMSGWSLLDEMRREKSSSRMLEAQVAQPANFLLQVALAELLRSWGVAPAAVIGHSAGEVAAAYVADVHDLPDAVRIIYHRSRLQQQTAGKGRMLAIGLGLQNARALIAGRETCVAIAAHNSVSSVALSGSVAVLNEISAELERKEVFNRFLHGDVPYHSPEMDALTPVLRAALADVVSRPGRVPLYSSVFGRLVQGEAFDPNYWCDNIRQPVLFADAIDHTLADGYTTFMEIGPHPVLSGSVKESLRLHGIHGDVLASLTRDQREAVTLRTTVAGLYVNGREVNWRALTDHGALRVKLPTYPWRRERLWFAESPESIAYRLGRPDHPLLGMRVADPEPTWDADLSSSTLAYVNDHVVENMIVFPGSGYIEQGLAIHAAVDSTKTAVVEDIEFRQALIIESGTQNLVRARFDERTREYSVYGRRDGDAAEWTLHARGRIAAAPPIAPKRVALDEIRLRCGDTIVPETLYGRLAACGLRYGPAFQRIDRLWCSTGEAIAELKGFSDVGTGYRLHPAVLDAAIQVLVAAIDAEKITKRPYVPVTVRRVTWHGPVSGSCWSHVRLVEQSQTGITGDVVICDNEGNVLAELRGIHCRALPSADRAVGHFDSLMYQPQWVPEERSTFSVEASRWLVFGDDGDLGEQLARSLVSREAAVSIDVVRQRYVEGRAASAFTPDEFSRILDARPAIERVVYLWPLDERDGSADPALSQSTVNFLYIAQALARQNASGSQSPRIYVVTQGAQNVGDEALTGLQQTGVIGLARTMLTEHPEFRCTVIDLDPSWDQHAASELTHELLSESRDTEVALRSSGRYVYRLARVSGEPAHADAPQEPTLTAGDAAAFRLNIGKPGRLETVRFLQTGLEPPGAREVQIRVHAAALNFKDVLKATGFLPAKAIERTYHGNGLGMEAAGVISAVGDAVTEYKLGEPVVVSAQNSFASHVTVPVERLFAARMLDTMSFVEAASVPVTFMTSYYGLHKMARLSAGETVLIHAAAGGVGLAALQVARWLGAKIIATAGSDEKRAYLRSLGIEHVLNSRTLDFADEVMAITAGRGVDVVLNSLPGEALLKSLSIVAPLGRFIEIGKRDIIENTSVPMLAFNNNLSLIAVDLDRIMAEQPEQIRGLLDDIWARFRAGDFAPTPIEVFRASHVADAFRRMAQSKQIGKIVVSLEDTTDVCVVARTIPQKLFRADATYMITGGCGGFGLEVAKWMAREGARHLVLLGRSGASTQRAQQVIGVLESQGVNVHVRTVDASEEDQVVECLSGMTTMPPLRGIVHAAGVLDDAIMLNLDATRLLRVMAPKARGAWILHKHTQHAPLDFFVLFSSVSSLVGSPGQGNYVAANAYLDALAHHRRAMGLPATCINWGALSEVGMAATNKDVAAHLARGGMKPLEPQDAVRALGMALERNATQIAVFDLDWQKWRRAFRSMADLPKFAAVLDEGTESSADSPNPFRSALVEANLQDRVEIAVLAIADLIGEATRMPPEKIDPQASLMDLGIDSLMALEVQVAIESRFGVSCSVLDLQKGDGLRGLAQRLVSRMALPAEVMN